MGRWALGGPLPTVAGSAALLAILSLGGAAVIAARGHLSEDTPPSQHPRVAALGTATVGVVVGFVAVVAAGLDGGAPGFLEISVVLVAGLVVLSSMAVWWLSRRGRLDSTLAAVANFVAPETSGGPMTVPARRSWRYPLRSEVAWAIGVAVVFVAAYALLVTSGPLGHDESVYAVKARSWLDGTPATGFEIYRPIGMPIVAAPVLLITESAAALRVLGVAGAVFTLGVLWGFGRAVFSPAAALLAVGMVGGAASWLHRVPEFLNDIASAGLLLLVMFLIWQHFERPTTSRWLIVFSAPLAAGAFYLRYGVVAALVIVAIVGAIVWRRRLASSWRQLAATAGALVVLIAPHVVYSLAEIGSVTGILSRATDAAGREYLGEGLATYLRWFPGQLAGRLLGGVMVAAVVATVVLIARSALGRSPSAVGRGSIFLGSSAILMMIASGIFVHAEERYVFLSILLLSLIGSHLMVAAYRRTGPQIRTAVLGVGVVVIAGVFVVNAVRADRAFDDLAENRAIIAAAGDALEAAAGPDCQAISTYLPQITWYSGCRTVGFVADPTALAEESPGGSAYVVVFEHGKRQPSGDALEDYLASTTGVVARIEDSRDRVGSVVIYELDAGS